MKRILIIEDDREIAELERDYLVINNFECDIETTGTSGLAAAIRENYDLCIIDIMLPGIDGFEVLSQLRRVKQTPVIFLSAKSSDIDKIRGLGLGADDYMTKPFSPGELVARVKAHISRYEALLRPSKDIITVRSLYIDPQGHMVKINGNEIPMTAKEFDLLLFLAQNPNRAFSKEQLFDKIWGFEAIGDISTVAVHIQRIREKLSVSGEKFIDTVWGVGYRFLK
ncbi:MAG: response regulator transcription factor [Clostridiales bacterium]|nr:response regulator transcription factor [Clostridiales bacterium]